MEDQVSHPRNVAVYWDFENIHISLAVREFGEEWVRRNRFRVQDPVVQIAPIIEFVNSVGSININRAYANWGLLHRYSQDLQQQSMDLIQLFPRGGSGKNGSDIRLAIDVIEDLSINPQIDEVVIVGGDSDYISVAQKVRQKGKRIIGIGVRETTNQYWMMACNEFKYYSSLLIKSSVRPPAELADPEMDLEELGEGKALMRRAMQLHKERTGQSSILRAALKPLMVKLEPSFDEGNFGFSNFSGFLDNCRDVITIHLGDHDQVVSLKEDAEHGLVEAPVLEDSYERMLRQQQVRLPQPIDLLYQATDHVWHLFQEEPILESWNDFRNRLNDRFKNYGVELDESEPSRIKNILFKSYAFAPNPERKVELKPFASPAELREKVLCVLIKRILDNVDRESVDREKIVSLLSAEAVSESDVQAMIEKYYEASDSTDLYGTAIATPDPVSGS